MSETGVKWHGFVVIVKKKSLCVPLRGAQCNTCRLGVIRMFRTGEFGRL